MDFRGFCGGLNLGTGGIGTAIGDVVENRIIEQNRVLRHHANGVMQRALRHLGDILPVNQNLALLGIVKAEQ